MVMVMDGGVAIIMTFHHNHKKKQYLYVVLILTLAGNVGQVAPKMVMSADFPE